MRPLTWLSSLCAVPQQAGAQIFFGQADLGSTSLPLPPSQDPWYAAPDDFESTEPGTILRIRSAPGDLPAALGNLTAAYNILYRTTDTRYQPSWAVTTLLIPTSTYVSPSGSKAVLSYQFAYDSAAIDSSPSYLVFHEASQLPDQLGLPSDASFVNDLLGQGWIINTPDYEGPAAAFGASVQAGHATLDAQRAVFNLARLTGAGDITVALWGYSGGSIATESAAELQVQYAPELKISGAVVGGVVDDIAADFDLMNKTPLAGHMASVIMGVTVQYPEADAYVRSRLRPETASDFLQIKKLVLANATAFFAGQDMYSYFIGGASDLKAPILQRVFNRETRLGYHGVPAIPMFVYKAIGDQYCPIVQTDALIKKYCEVGADITYERNTIGTHVSEINNGKGRALSWLWSIFNESYVPHSCGCKVKNVTVDASA